MAVEPTTPTWRPTQQRVAALLWEHTRDSQDITGERGVLLDEPVKGAFTANTDPPVQVVETLIDQAVDDMYGLLDGHEPCTAGLVGAIRSATTYLAAALVDQAREIQNATGENTAYSNLIALWRDKSQIAARVQLVCPVIPDPDNPNLPDPTGRLGPVAVLPNNPTRITWDTPL
jgi:hypothetical protein